jgi:hypothetical protein
MSTKVAMEQETGPKDLPHAPAAPAVSEAILATLERKFIKFLETGWVPDGLFADDVFLDFTPPLWRLQASGVQDALALRRAGHPSPGTVPRWRTDRTDRGFVIEFEEIWSDAASSGIAVKWRGRTSQRCHHGVVHLLHR